MHELHSVMVYYSFLLCAFTIYSKCIIIFEWLLVNNPNIRESKITLARKRGEWACNVELLHYVVSCYTTIVDFRFNKYVVLVFQVKTGRTKLSAPPSDPYQEFLAEQKKRGAKWCEKTKAKKTRNEEKEPKSSSASVTAEHVTAIKLQLESKNWECALLRDQLLVQDNICKVRMTAITLLVHKMSLGKPFL